MQFLSSDTLLIRMRGWFEYENFLNALERLLNGPEWVPGLNALWDLRQLSESELNESQIHAIVSKQKKNKAKLGNGKAAIVTNSMLHFGIARQYEILMSIKAPFRPIGVFYNFEDALSWLKEEMSYSRRSNFCKPNSPQH